MSVRKSASTGNQTHIHQVRSPTRRGVNGRTDRWTHTYTHDGQRVMTEARWPTASGAKNMQARGMVLCNALCLMKLYICEKFYQNILTLDHTIPTFNDHV